MYPFIQLPSQATFRINGELQTVELQWQPLSAEDESALLENLRHRFTPDTQLTQWREGHWWLSLPEFGPQSKAEAEADVIHKVLAQFEENIDAIKAAKQLVVDLRGNRGGSGFWPTQFAALIWGEKAVESLSFADSIDYRATPANLTWFENIRKHMEEEGLLDEQFDYFFNLIIQGIRDAIEKGQPFYIAQEDEIPATDTPTPSPKVAVYILTDDECFSASLDAVDIFRSLGAIHIGRETDGDTVYMELRQAESPDHHLEIGVPTKVWRNRLRDSWQTWVPHFAYLDDLSDTQAIQQWVETLPLIKPDPKP